MQGLIGQEVGGYRIISQIGKGGMATVYKAYQPSLDRYVAVKVMPPFYAEQDDTFLKRFRQEAKAIASLRHPNILIVIDYGEENDTTYIVMEFVEAGTLTDQLGGPMAPSQMNQLIGQVARALHYAHEQGVVHRDIKPSNILLPKPDWPLLTDFGLAKIVGGSQLTQSGTVAGTPAYMSPEQGRGEKVDSRSDIYSLGIVLYEMATGVVPFHAETPMAVVVKHIIDPLPMPKSKNPELPEEIERVILKALSKEPESRYQDAAEMGAALEEAVKSLPTELASKAPEGIVDQSTTVVDTSGDVDAAAQAAAAAVIPQIDQELEAPDAAEVAPTSDADRESAGMIAGRGRLIAGIAGAVLVLGAVIVGATQLLGGQSEEAEEPRTQEQIVADARATLGGDDPSGAIDDLDRAIEGDPENIDLYFERARAEMAAGNRDGAIESIHLGIDVSPEESWVHEYAGNTMWELGFYDEAIDRYRTAIDLDPGASWLFLNIAQIYTDTGRQEQAVGALFEGLEHPELGSSPGDVNGIGWMFYDLELFDEAEQAFNRAVDLEPDNPSWYEGLVEIAYVRGGTPAALEMLETGMERFPEHWPFFEQAGYYYWDQNVLDRAEESFRRAVEVAPHQSGGYSALAYLLRDLGRNAEAKEVIQSGVEQNQENPEFLSNIAGAFVDVGEGETAVTLLEKAIELDPGNAWYRAVLARTHAELGNHDRTRQILEEIPEIKPDDDPWFDEFIGWTYMMLDECEHALPYFYTALEMDPSIESAEQGIAECGG